MKRKATLERFGASRVDRGSADRRRARNGLERRLAALAAFLESYENTRGGITDEEIRDAARRARSRAVTVRGPKRKQRKVE